MAMNPRLLRPKASGVIAVARDSSGNVIPPIQYAEGGENYVAHIFNASGSLEFRRAVNAEYLIVAGGGGGGRGFSNRASGGGGAGGLLTNHGSPASIAAGTYTVTVGAGGAGRTSGSGLGTDGSSSSALGVSASGGGASHSTANGNPGGSGGGGGGDDGSGGTGGTGISGQGSAGGNAASKAGGGGGGAGGVGGNAVVSTSGGNGGAGVTSTFSGASVAYAGGGGGAIAGTANAGGAATAGGGSGGSGAGTSPAAGANGVANTGGGGGGGANSGVGGNGGSGIVIVRYRRNAAPVAFDSDALAYIAAVESADSAVLEPGIRTAYNDFIVGCKSDGIWTAIKASCILMGARTLAGALTPLVGAAPTNHGPFVAGDYGRKTGLVGNGTSKYLDTNRNANADPQDNFHFAFNLSVVFTSANLSAGAGGAFTGATQIQGNQFRCRNGSGDTPTVAMGSVGLHGINRSASADYVARCGQTNQTFTRASQAPFNGNLFTHARLSGGTAGLFSAMRINYYSIGESLNLATLESRVSTLASAIGAAIP